MSQRRIEECAQFLEELMEATAEAASEDGYFLEQMANESALAAGFTEAEIEAAWAVVDNQEGA